MDALRLRSMRWVAVAAPTAFVALLAYDAYFRIPSLLSVEIAFALTIGATAVGAFLFSRAVFSQIGKREDTILHRSRELAALNRLIQVINSTLDLQTAFEAFVAEARELLPLDRASLGILDEAAQALRMLAASGLMAQQIGRGRLVPMKDNARVADAIARRQTNLVGDLEREQTSPMDARLAQEGIRAAMVVPIVAQAQVIGVLNLGARRANAYTAEHVALAEQLAAQFATAVVNARLYDQEQERARQLSTLN
ncbi:MAG: GAF domain-containing protein [Chloroflexi bacterium]|nr:GAF domain-containing protein [Chloroflexota bacterium]